MRFGLIVIVALIAGAVIAQFLLEDRGYVMLSFAGYIVEMSVPVLLLLLALLYLSIRLLLRILRAPRQLGQAAGRYRARKAHQQLTRGLIAISEGNWARGERILTRGIRQSDAPLLNYLAAARAAQLQGADERRDNWLRMAHDQTPEAATAVLLTQAELQMGHGQYEQALATLRQLDEFAPNHAHALMLLARIYRGLGDWEQLRELLPRVRNRKAVDPGTLQELSRETHMRLLEQAGTKADSGALENAWRQVPRTLRTEPQVFKTYVRAAIECDHGRAAEPLVRKALKTDWDDELVLLYGELKTAEPARELRRVETWLKERGDDAQLLLTAARLSMRNELWGKARSYLESSIAMHPRVEAYQLYGRLLEQLGEEEQAARAFRSGLALATAHSGEVPALEAPEDEFRVES